MRNLKLIAGILFVAILLVGVFYLLRPTGVQNDTSLSMNDQKVEHKTTFNQRATQTKVDTPPKAKVPRKVVQPKLSPTGKKINPLKGVTPTNLNERKIGETSSVDKSVSSLPPSKASAVAGPDKELSQQSLILKPQVSSKKNAARDYRKKKILKSNN